MNRRQLHREDPSTISSASNTRKPKDTMEHSHFHFDIWLLLTMENWILDFGRPIFALYVSDVFPLSKPSLGDYCHMAYNVITAFCLMTLLRRSLRPVPAFIQQLLVTFFVMGASIHLVGDSVQHRLIHSGYQLHLSVRDNPIMQNLKPKSLVESFELLYFYDEVLGHEMWYIPLFCAYLVYFFGCFGRKVESRLSAGVWVLLIGSAMFEWYLVTEGQIFVIFVLMVFGMFIVLFWRRQQGLEMDTNGKFLLYRSILTLVLVGVWVFYLWDDAVLRKKYPELLYIPEPWSYASLYIMKH